MKTIHYSLLMGVALMFSLIACNNGKATASKPNATDTAAAVKPQPKVQKLTTEAFKLRVMDFERHPQEWVFEGDKPAMVDFYATWCGPCKIVTPVIESMAHKYDGRIDFYKVDVDDEKELAMSFGISSIPSLLFIPASGKPHMQVGVMDSLQMDSVIQHVLLAPKK